MDTSINARYAVANIILHSLQISWASGDRSLAKAMGVRVEDIEHLFTLSAFELAQLSCYGDQFLEVRVNPDKIRRLTELSRSKVREEQLITGLLRAGATYEFMNRHFGIENQEISRRKTRLRLSATKQTKRHADLKEFDQIIAAHKKLDTDRLPVTEIVYRIHCETGLNAAMIANLLNDDGQFKE